MRDQLLNLISELENFELNANSYFRDGGYVQIIDVKLEAKLSALKYYLRKLKFPGLLEELESFEFEPGAAIRILEFIRNLISREVKGRIAKSSSDSIRTYLDKKRKNRKMLAIKQCLESTFSDSDWEELSILVHGGKEIILNHHRLFKSRYFGDDDYGRCVLEVLEELALYDEDNLKIIRDHINLADWLKENNPQEYKLLFEKDKTEGLLAFTGDIAIKNSFELHHHLDRIRHAIEIDPELAVGSTKELLEAVLKTILEYFEVDFQNDKFNTLLKKVQKELKLSPDDFENQRRGEKIIKRTLSNLGQVVNGINQLRNLYGTGHGKATKSSVYPRHARLVVGSGATLAIFLMETFEKMKPANQ